MIERAVAHAGSAAARNENAEGTLDDYPLLRSTYYGRGHSERVIPLTEDGLRGARAPRSVARLAINNLGLVQDQDHSQADIEAALRREVPALLAQAPRVNTVDGMKHKIAIESAVVWVWDESKEIAFDEQVFRHLHGDGQPLIETLLDRPLLGLPYIDEKMYGRQGLSKIACMDLTDRGGCVVAQIVETVMEVRKVAKAGARKVVRTLAFKSESLASLLSRSWQNSTSFSPSFSQEKKSTRTILRRD